jgi:hypothetical protein
MPKSRGIENTRLLQPVLPAPGLHFRSPVKRRDKRKRNTAYVVPLQESLLASKLGRIKELKESIVNASHHKSALWQDEPMEYGNMADEIVDVDPAADVDMTVIDTSPEKSRRRIVPNTEASRLYSSWKALIPSLVDPLLQFISDSMGCVISPASNLYCECTRQDCVAKTTSMTCIYYNRESNITDKFRD